MRLKITQLLVILLGAIILVNIIGLLPINLQLLVYFCLLIFIYWARSQDNK